MLCCLQSAYRGSSSCQKNNKLQQQNTSHPASAFIHTGALWKMLTLKMSGWETDFSALQFMKQSLTSKARDLENLTTSLFLKTTVERWSCCCLSKWSNYSLKVLFLEKTLMVTLHHKTSYMKVPFMRSVWSWCEDQKFSPNAVSSKLIVTKRSIADFILKPNFDPLVFGSPTH